MTGLGWASRLSLRKKILLLAVGAELLILGVASILGLYILSGNRAQLSQAMANSLVYSSERLDQSLDNVKSLTSYILSDTAIQRQLSIVHSGEQTPERRIAYQALYNSIIGFYQQYRHYGIRYISLITGAFSVHSGSDAARTPPEVTQALYEQVLENEGRAIINTQWSQSHGLFVSRAIRQVQPFNLATTGVLIICLDLEQLVKDATTFNNAYEHTYYMLNGSGGVFYQSPALSGQDAQAVLRGLKGDYGVVRLRDGHYFAQRGAMDEYGWDYICLVSYDKQWNGQRSSYLLFLSILLAAMLVTAILSSVIAHSISKGFTALADKMRVFRGQEMARTDGGREEAARTDEVGLLHRHFDKMAGEITQLIQERYVSELLAKEAQLQALEAQINPHFLYNVLESINWRAQAAGAPDISRIVDALGRFLRVSLNRHKKLLTLGEELALVECYMVIQRYRFEDRLVYTRHVPQDLMNVQIPKLAIQPLVENAVKYAVESSLDECCDICVEAYAARGVLVIDVKNSGSRMEAGLLEHLRTGEIRPHGFGIGLTNIDARMRLTFGEGFGLQLFNEGSYAVCRLRIPLDKTAGIPGLTAAAPAGEGSDASPADRG